MKRGLVAIGLSFAICAHAQVEEIVECKITRVLRSTAGFPDVDMYAYIGRFRDIDVDFVGIAFASRAGFSPLMPEYIVGEVIGDFRWRGPRFEVNAEGPLLGNEMALKARGRIDDPSAQARISVVANSETWGKWIDAEVVAEECRRL